MKYIYLLMIIILIIALILFVIKLADLSEVLSGIFNKLDNTNSRINCFNHKYDLLSKNISKKVNVATKLVKGYVFYQVVKEIYDDDDELHGVKGYGGAMNRTIKEINHKKRIESLFK